MCKLGQCEVASLPLFFLSSTSSSSSISSITHTRWVREEKLTFILYAHFWRRTWAHHNIRLFFVFLFSHSLTPCCPIVVWDCVLFMLRPTGPTNRSPFSILFKLCVRPPQRRWHGIVESNKPNLLYRSRLHMQQKMTNFFSLTRLPFPPNASPKTQHSTLPMARSTTVICSCKPINIACMSDDMHLIPFSNSFGYERFNHWHWVAKRSRQLRILTRMRKRSCDAEDSREMKNGNWFIFERCSTWMIDCSFSFFFSVTAVLLPTPTLPVLRLPLTLSLFFSSTLLLWRAFFTYSPRGMENCVSRWLFVAFVVASALWLRCVHCTVLSGRDFDATRKAN